MADVKFCFKDAGILYTIPKKGASISFIISCYCSINRAAPPHYEDFMNCISKAIKVGCLEMKGFELFVTEEWYERIHAADDAPGSEIDSMLDFTDILLKTSWEVKYDTIYTLSEEKYDSAVRSGKLKF
ncbi:MAG: hypothetical protein COA78_16635 [Blastopirellula sp.]|nr:MAG: hypothetical protein COA78_16635 [Blastopirellula sp.]